MKNFLQSEQWRRFQEKNGRETVNLPGGGFGIIHRIPLAGAYLYVPQWPNENSASLTLDVQKELSVLLKEKSLRWVRVEPQSDVLLDEWRSVFGERLNEAPNDIQPREILVVPLAGTSEERLARMKSKTRYNIRLAEKHGVAVRFSRAEKDIEAFLVLIQATTKRKGIRPHPVEYYRNFFSVFGEGECVLALAEHEGDLLAAGLIVFYAGTAYYLHGGSSHTKRDLMAPFLLHFRAMEEAQHRGCTKYDFGGVATQSSNIYHQSSKQKEWAGITRFKQGFAPDTPTTIYPGTFDIIFDVKGYILYRLLSQISKLRKRFRKFFTRS